MGITTERAETKNKNKTPAKTLFDVAFRTNMLGRRQRNARLFAGISEQKK